MPGKGYFIFKYTHFLDNNNKRKRKENFFNYDDKHYQWYPMNTHIFNHIPKA